MSGSSSVIWQCLKLTLVRQKAKKKKNVLNGITAHFSLKTYTPNDSGFLLLKKFPGSNRKAVTEEEESIRQGSLSSWIMGNGINNMTALTVFIIPMPFPFVYWHMLQSYILRSLGGASFRRQRVILVIVVNRRVWSFGCFPWWTLLTDVMQRRLPVHCHYRHRETERLEHTVYSLISPISF